VTGGWRGLHKEGLHNFCSSPNLIIITKSRRIRWAGHVAHMGEEENCVQGFGGKSTGRDTTRKSWMEVRGYY
jgi:hypothetical protein